MFRDVAQFWDILFMYICSACICIYNTVLRCAAKYVATVPTWFEHVNYRQFLVVSLPMNLKRMLHFTVVFRCYQKRKLNDGLVLSCYGDAYQNTRRMVAYYNSVSRDLFDHNDKFCRFSKNHLTLFIFTLKFLRLLVTRIHRLHLNKFCKEGAFYYRRKTRHGG